ncbi:alpha/beta hydrolase [Corticibacter populi]|uniref:Alpha/beta hydrolase n=1 Tax=Corticibacter populi TaxID=1550736 RepID=A0A3M6QTF6_9BURK|nr:alpha/beta hydrolase [Corticibacter populi]RMX06324.1 alpha/beta hydrolase [Corticibacter populi]RZS32138.1 non-specific protein-tyrosine kinase [Corticibacter populi]
MPPRYPDMPPAQTIHSNGVPFSVHVAGTGLPVILLHGFPELAYSWRHQIAPLVQAGCQVIVPDLRGYGHTGTHGALHDYRMANLALDVTGILDALGAARAVVVGHDFGGALAWTLARDHADRVLGIASLNTPYTRHTDTDLLETLRAHKGPGNYMVFFQQPGAAEELLGRDVYQTFSGMMRRPALSLQAFRQGPAHWQALPATILGQEPALWGEPFLDAQELAVYVDTYRVTGFTGGLNWYRNLRQNWLDGAGTDDRVRVPALMVSADRDFVLPPETTRGMEQYVPDLARHTIADCGHWTQHERADEVSSTLLGWLRQRQWLAPA